MYRTVSHPLGSLQTSIRPTEKVKVGQKTHFCSRIVVIPERCRGVNLGLSCFLHVQGSRMMESLTSITKKRAWCPSGSMQNASRKEWASGRGRRTRGGVPYSSGNFWSRFWMIHPTATLLPGPAVGLSSNSLSLKRSVCISSFYNGFDDFSCVEN